jgi:hypothetical protein
VLAVALVAGQLGCGGSTAADLTKAAANVQNTAAAVQQAVEETATKAAGLTTGSVELDVNGPLKTDRCSAWFTPPSGDRPAVLQLTTTETLDADPKFTEYPSVYVWASVPVTSSEELQPGRTLQGQLMVRREPLREIWQNELLQPVTITITAVDSWSIECEVKDAELKRLDADGTVKAAGKFRAIWK